jgi:hypothetical protein
MREIRTTLSTEKNEGADLPRAVQAGLTSWHHPIERTCDSHSTMVQIQT